MSFAHLTHPHFGNTFVLNASALHNVELPAQQWRFQRSRPDPSAIDRLDRVIARAEETTGKVRSKAPVYYLGLDMLSYYGLLAIESTDPDIAK